MIWDPFLAAAQAATGARTLADGTGLVKNHQFYLASQSFAADQPAVVQAILAELGETDRWASGNTGEVAALLAPRHGHPGAGARGGARTGWATACSRSTSAVAAEQQQIADTFHGLGLLPKPITVKDAVWKASA